MLNLEPRAIGDAGTPVHTTRGDAPSGPWSMGNNTTSGVLRVGRYLLAVLGLNLIWEFAQLPLYTIWANEPIGAAALAVVHCTIGDGLIAGAALLSAWLVTGRLRLRAGMPLSVAAVAIGLGVAFTIVSERRATLAVHSWEYSSWMPVIPWLQVGLTPVLQWFALPPIAMQLVFGIGKRLSARRIRS